MKLSIGVVMMLTFAPYFASAACTDNITGCQKHWCGDAYWSSECKATCNICPEETGGDGDGDGNVLPLDPTTPACEDIQEGCQPNWCTDSYWNNQCKSTCGSCDGFEDSTTTASPTVTTAPVEPTSSSPTVSTSTVTTATPTVSTSTVTTAAPTGGNSPSPPTPNPDGKKYVMYYPAWATYARDFQVADIDASKLTHINYAFANIANGECVLGDAYADTEKFFAETDNWNDATGTLRGNINQLHVLKQKHPHVVNMISLGGWTWSTEFSGLASTQSGREKFASSCVDYMLTYGFDGIDIDWEFPVSGGMAGIPNSPDDKENFTLLLQAFRDYLDATGHLTGIHYPLTIATSADPAKTTTSYDVPAISPILDFVNVMTYDFNGAWNDRTGHNAPLYPNPSATTPEFNVDTAVDAFLDAGLPKKKLILGLGFYGRGWSNVVAAADGNGGLFASANGASPGTWEDGVLDYSDLVLNYINKNGYTRYWDSVSKVPYLFNPETKVFISYDDQESICYKAQYANEKGLGGGMVWEVTSDYNKELQQLSYDVMVGGATHCTF